MDVLCIIPARGGSKGVPGKNIRLVDGHPLIAYTIVVAKSVCGIDRVIVSTDSEKIVSEAKKYGAEVPFLRPAILAQDQSTDLEYVMHALDWFKENESWEPSYVVQLRPTTPFRDPKNVTDALQALKKNTEATSLRSAHELTEPPQKMLCVVNGYFEGFFPEDKRPDYFNLPRQSFPKAYHPNGYVDVIIAKCMRQSKKLYGNRILSWITEFSVEVDAEDDFTYLEWLLQRKGNPVHHLLSAQK